MNKALPCKNCGNESYLQFKHNGPNEWWVHCDECGEHGPAKPTPPEAGEAWNKANKQKD